MPENNSNNSGNRNSRNNRNANPENRNSRNSNPNPENRNSRNNKNTNPDNQNNRNNNNNRRGRYNNRRRNDRNRGRHENQTLLKCGICEKEIRDSSSAIAQRESGQPAHFDCIIKKLEETESIAQHEKICYLGKGSFGIVRFQRMGGLIPFVIRKRIQYEEFEDTPDWRKGLNKYYAAHPLYKPKEPEPLESE